MNQHPVEFLEPFFRFLDQLIIEHGDWLFVGLAWLSPFLAHVQKLIPIFSGRDGVVPGGKDRMPVNIDRAHVRI